ncbi:SUKH-4 family immunity protein [Streptomyces bluensis]|uniref:SUKH-4 family immunity protein n=1 Tax=Streptomyces bluensis TaxID=33897 RepID=A0ABW6UPG2_9ACTN
MVTFAQAQERAEEWINGDVPGYQHREVRVREFELGFVVWAEDRAEGPRSDGGAQRLVIARDSGEATLWPGLPVGEVIRRYEEEYGRTETAPEPESAPPPARVDLNQTSFLLTPPEWLQEAADKLGVSGEGSGADASDGEGSRMAGAGAGSDTGSVSDAVPGREGALPETLAGPSGAADATPWPAAGAVDDVRDAPPQDRVPGVAPGATPWAGTDTNAGAEEDRSVPLPQTVFAPPLTGVDDADVPPPGVAPEAKTALLSGGSQLPPTVVSPPPNEPGGPQGAPSAGASSYGYPQGPGTPPPGAPGYGYPQSPGTPPPGAGEAADAATGNTPPPPPPPPGAPGVGYLPTQLAPQVPAPPGAPGAPGVPAPPGAPGAPGVPGGSQPSGGSTPPGGTPGGGVHHAATVLSAPPVGGPGAPMPPGPPGAPGRPGAPGVPAPPGAPGAPGVPAPPPPPPPPGVPGAPGAPVAPGTPGVPGAVHHAETMLAAPPVGPPGAPGAPGAPGVPPPPAPPGMPPGAPRPVPGQQPVPGQPPAPGQQPPAYGYPQQPSGQPTVGPGYQAVLRYRAPDGSEQQVIRRSAPGVPHPEWQIFHELRGMNIPPDQVLELHTELESCELPGAYCARMIREQWPNARITSIAPYGTDHASRQQGMAQLLAHQGELHQVADGPARPAPVRAPLPPVQPAPPIPPEGVAQELAAAFGPGLFRFDQQAVSRQGVPPIVGHSLVVGGLPVDMGPFFWAQAQPARPVPTLAELAQERGVQPASDAGSYLVMGSDFGKALCVQYGTANIVAVPVEAAPGGAPVPPQFVNTGLPEFQRCLALLGRMWRLRYGLNQEQAGRWTVDFQAQLAALDQAALGSPESWWSVLLEQMWDGLL